MSGVPQGSILGPIIFVLFMNDLPNGLSNGTNIALYADDTKIWRSIKITDDIAQLQGDIDYLHSWSLSNKMNFHPKKCKVLSLKHRPSPLAMLPFVAYHYYLAENMLSYADSERDLGVHMNKNFNFSEHCEKILCKANQHYGILKRTCHFVSDSDRRRILYLTLVRSQFEHCSPVWRPNGSYMISKLENFQKKCIKWILKEEEKSYCNNIYLRKCKQLNLLPLLYRFNINDLILFHKIVNEKIPVDLPNYLTLFDGQTRLRTTHLDSLSLVSNVNSRTIGTNNLNKSFFFRTHALWNSIPFDIRNTSDISQFRFKINKYYWDLNSDEIFEKVDEEWHFDISDDGG